MHTAQRLAIYESSESFEAQREFADREAAFAGKSAAPQPFDVLRKIVLGSVDDAQVFAASALERRLQQANLVGPAGLPSTPFSGTLPTIAAPLPAGFTMGTDGVVRDASGNQALAGTTRLPNGNLITTAFGSFGAVRPSLPTGTGLPRAVQFGLRFSF